MEHLESLMRDFPQSGSTIGLPDRTRKGDVVISPLLRDFVLVFEEPFGVFMAEIGIELIASSTNHLFTVDAVFAGLQDFLQLEAGH